MSSSKESKRDDERRISETPKNEPRKSVDGRIVGHSSSVQGVFRQASERAKGRYVNASLSSSFLTFEDNQKIMDWLKNAKGFLIYQGCAGCGKTHLCHSLQNEARKLGKFNYIRLWNESQFFQRLRSGIKDGNDYYSHIQSLSDDDLIIYDDMGSTSGDNVWRNEAIFALIDFRWTLKKPTIITTNLTETEIQEKIGFRVHSRLFAKENTILDFGKRDLRQEPITFI